MKIVIAIGGSILLQDYNAERFKEYAKLLKEQKIVWFHLWKPVERLMENK